MIKFSQPYEVSNEDLEPHPLVKNRHIEHEDQVIFRADIKEHGVLEPVLISKEKNTRGKHWILNGRRRWTTNGKVGHKKILVRHLLTPLTDSVRRRIMYGGNQLPKHFTFDEIVEIIIIEYGKVEIFKNFQGGTPDRRKLGAIPLSEEIAKDLGVSKRYVQTLLKAARAILTKKPIEPPTIKEGELVFIYRIISEIETLEKEEKKIETAKKKLVDARRKKAKELRVFGGVDRCKEIVEKERKRRKKARNKT
ncbi:hypothetical protein EHO57_14120 [Leptospira langatensis]|uniref:ParB-like N-terminal domain-containing protein n=1 Tax=Leptospira langatensis TaxID=2484983 RepID=A0A5R2ATB7_9LEPT|nr:ParB/Srx family N-terminal domain-containing protein [Leptospira langatensis]TGJ99891.1 hypothetical protein EHO57_14120 [Leptospira langatensis]